MFLLSFYKEQLMETKFKVGGMSCSACALRVEKAVSSVEGVDKVAVNLILNEMMVSYSSPADDKAIIAAVVGAGYTAKKDEEKSRAVQDKPTKKILFRLIASVALLVPLMYVSMGSMWGAPIPSFLSPDENPLSFAIFQAVLALVILVINGKFFVSGMKSIIHLSPNMDALVMIGAGASYLYSLYFTFKIGLQPEHAHHYIHQLYFEGAATIVTLITVGKWLESLSKGRTTDAIKSLTALMPETAVLLKDDKEVTVPVEDVKVGDLFVVRTGDSVPVDGVIVKGNASVNQANLTGESIPVDKIVGDEISSSTVNMNGYIVAKATRVGEDSTINKIVEMVKNVSLTKAPIAKIADKVASVFVPSVMGIALVTFVVWLIVGAGISEALKYAVAVLVISCPCALGLATPVAIMVGSGVGAKHGVLYKTATSLEALGKCKIVVLDKTGTITYGKPEVTDIIPAALDEEKLKNLAASLESLSGHPLAKAVTDSLGSGTLNIENFEEMSGSGLKASYKGNTVYAGNLKLMKSQGVNTSDYEETSAKLASDGKTPLFFSVGGELAGIIAVADKPKKNAKEVIEKLSLMGVETYMLTGDNKATASAIAAKVGIPSDRVISDVLPQDKQSVVLKLKENGRTAMVGDGVNDAPALSAADVGVAMSNGSFVAVDAAEVVVMNDLSSLLFSFKLSKRTILNVKENLFWAFIYNVIGIPIAAGVFSFLDFTLSPMLAAAAMSLSSVFVVSNALRLNFVKPDKLSDDLPRSDACESVCKTQTQTIKTKEDDIMTEKITVRGMMCAHCEATVEKAVQSLNGVKSCKADHANNLVTVEFSSPATLEEIKQAIAAKDYTVE